MAYNVYSLPDCRTVLYHPDVGTANLHQCGHGKITVSSAGDLTSHTMTADGYVVVNKLKSTYCKPPFRDSSGVIHYLGRYTHRVAISNNRILNFRYQSLRQLLRWLSGLPPSSQLLGIATFTFSILGRVGGLVHW